MKICSKCKQEKELSEFCYKKSEKRYNSYCKSCLYAYQIKRWIDRKLWAIEYKGGRCSECGLIDLYVVYDFHHLDPKSKEFDWNRLKEASKETLIKELDKCILLCSNCHRKIHSIR